MKKEDTVLAGFHAVSSRMKRDPSSIRIVYYDPKRRDQRMRRMIEEIEKAGIRLMQADNNRLDGFSHEVPHQGLIALAAPIDIGMSFDTLMDNLAGNPLLLLLDGVTDPRNFGACLRVADAAGVSAVITPKDRSATLTAAAVKASAGASETVPIVRVTNLAGSIVELVDAGVPIIGTAGEAQKTIYEFDQKGAFGKTGGPSFWRRRWPAGERPAGDVTDRRIKAIWEECLPPVRARSRAYRRRMCTECI